MSDDRPTVHSGHDDQGGDFSFALPASFGQERLWFLSTANRGAHLAYQMLGAVRVTGALDLDRLENALRAVIARHEVLRTTFRHRDGALTQVVRPRLDFGLTRRTARDGCAGRAEDVLDEVLAAEAGTPFDLERGPLVRATVVTLAPDVHTLVLALHHAICDGWSLAVLFREITAYYARPDAQLPPPPIQYGDYAVWQRNRLASGELADQLDYWRHTLDGLEPLPLPETADAPAFAGGHRRHDIDPAVAAGLAALVRAEGTTVHAALTAVVTSVLRAHTGITDVAVGTAVAGRAHLDLERLVGFFVNTVVLRTDHTGDPTFRELLRRVADTCLDAFANQDVPFEQLVARLRPRRSAPNPYFSVMVTLQNQPPAVLDVPGLRFDVLPLAAHFSPFPLDFVFRHTGGDGLTCDLGHHQAILDTDGADRLWAAFETLLAAAVADPDRPLSTLLPTTATRASAPPPAKVRLVAELGVDTVAVLREDVPGEVHRIVYTTADRPPADAQAVVLDELPRTATGDVDLAALPAPHVAPRTDLERTIAEQWRTLLHEPMPIGVHDDFFDLGGHSLLAVRATNELGAVLGVELPVNVVLEHPTVARLAGHLGRHDYAPATEIRKLPRVLTH